MLSSLGASPISIFYFTLQLLQSRKLFLTDLQWVTTGLVAPIPAIWLTIRTQPGEDILNALFKNTKFSKLISASVMR